MIKLCAIWVHCGLNILTSYDVARFNERGAKVHRPTYFGKCYAINGRPFLLTSTSLDVLRLLKSDSCMDARFGAHVSSCGNLSDTTFYSRQQATQPSSCFVWRVFVARHLQMCRLVMEKNKRFLCNSHGLRLFNHSFVVFHAIFH